MIRLFFYLMVVITGLALVFASSSADTGKPLDAGDSRTHANTDYPNGGLLVSTKWLQKNFKLKNLAVIDVRTHGYENSHIPHAISLKYSHYRGKNSIKSITELEALLSRAGLRRDMKLVIYDDTTASWGTAGWFFWMLEYLGCTDVHILNGGWDRWVAEDRPKQTKAYALTPDKFVAAPKKEVLTHAGHIVNRLKAKDFVIIDARNDEEFNGWQLYGEARGGHIPGAINVNYGWLYKKDKTILKQKDLKSLLESRGITTNKEVTAYSTEGLRSGFVYFVLRLMGYPRCSNYDGSILDWAADPSLPMDKLAHYEKLVYPGWVKDLIDGEKPPTYSGKDYVILETRYTGFSISMPGMAKEEEYIPGALTIHVCYLDHENDTSKYYPNWTQPSDGNLLSRERLQEALKKLGITKQTTVIVYGNGKIIPMTSSRVAWALMYAGVEDVRVLNGGYTAWVAAGYPSAATPAIPVPASDFGSEASLHMELLATTDYVRAIVEGQNQGSVLVDIRKLKEYNGELNPYTFFDKKGHIPGAVWMGDWDTLVDMNDNTFRSYTEVQKIWKDLKITPDKEPVFYCGSGWRSSMGFFYAYLMGFNKIRNYDGGFYEWSWNPNNPISMGMSR